jgi:hypothetical protein
VLFNWDFPVEHEINNNNNNNNSIPTQGEIKKKIEKKGYILSRDSEVTLSHWSRSIELVIMPLIDL